MYISQQNQCPSCSWDITYPYISPFPIQYIDYFSHRRRALWQATTISWWVRVSKHPMTSFTAAVHPLNYANCTDLQHLATLIAVGNRSISFRLEQALAPKNSGSHWKLSNKISIKDLVNTKSLSKENSSNICLQVFAYTSFEAHQLSTRVCLHLPIFPARKMKLTTH